MVAQFDVNIRVSAKACQRYVEKGACCNRRPIAYASFPVHAVETGSVEIGQALPF